VPSSLYPVGRLDFDSEGLLILTNDASLNHRLLDPQFAHEREYWVQVEGAIDTGAIHQLESGIVISLDGKSYTTRPARVSLLSGGAEASPVMPVAFSDPPGVPVRVPPIRYRAHIPTSWIKMALKEGKNRQVRKMTAKAGFPTLRLIRYRIERLNIEGWQPGDMRAMRQQEIYPLLFGR